MSGYVKSGPVLFRDLKLIEPLQKSLAKAGYSSATPIQGEAIPPALLGRDLLGCAQTGTGKTAAFCLPILQRLDETAGDDPVVRALILTPTRELAAQIGESLSTYGAELDLWHAVIFGGVSDKQQIQALKRGVDILVATPGRLLDLMNRGFVNLKQLEVFVLDEADRMLDMGFVHDVRKVTAALPRKRQTLFFSATMPPEIRELADGLLNEPAVVSVTPVSSTAHRIEQHVCFVDKRNKVKLLVDRLRDPSCERVLVFSRTKHGANRIVTSLAKSKIASAAIHGNKSQGARTRALSAFKSGEIGVLIATDIAARGIDVDGVTHVINYDLPEVPETYVHRIGRTARAGRDGVAWSFCDIEERELLEDIERVIQKNIPRDLTHSFPPTEPPPEETDFSVRKNAARRPSSSRSGGARSGGARAGGGGGRPRSRPAGPSRNGSGRPSAGRGAGEPRAAGGARSSSGGRGRRPTSSR